MFLSAFQIIQSATATSPTGLRPEELLVVGDNPDSEIEAGNRLGMKTIQILRPGVPPSNRATQQIRGLMELKVLL